MIRTVLGDIPKEKLGITMCHEHFNIDLDHIRHDGISKIATVEEVVPEIEAMMELGVRAAMEVSTIDMLRDPKKLKEIAAKTGLNIVAATGFYLSQYHPEDIKDMTKEDIAKIFQKEVTTGMADTDIKAGVIAEIASSPKSFVGEELKVLKAAGIAARNTGAAVSTHTGRYTAHETVDTLLKEGVNADKIIIGHQDLIDDVDYHVSLLEKGVNIGFDTCGKTSYMADETRAKNIITLIRRGYGKHILLSNDVSRRTYFLQNGNFGYTAVMKVVVPLLKDYGLTKDELDDLLIHNPARILDNDWRQECF